MLLCRKGCGCLIGNWKVKFRLRGSSFDRVGTRGLVETRRFFRSCKNFSRDILQPTDGEKPLPTMLRPNISSAKSR